MMVCLRCYRAGHKHSSYCGCCGRSFGGRFCPRQHFSPSHAAHCTQCGSDKLSEPTPCFSLGCTTLGVVALGAMILMGKLFGVIGTALGSFTAWLWGVAMSVVVLVLHGCSMVFMPTLIVCALFYFMTL